MIIFGTRPEAIKLAPLIKKLKHANAKLRPVICVTAQHRQMLDQVLKIFDIGPEYDLNIMTRNQSLFEVSASALKKLGPIIKKEKPDLVLVQGDTTTSFIASLAAYYLRIKIGHIEAGLRTYDKYNPFPEEINRRLADCLADYYFAPTGRARENLIREGVDKAKIYVTGNTVIDALFMIVEKQKKKRIQRALAKEFHDRYGISLDNHRIILVTGHRRESFGKEFENVCYGFKRIAEHFQDVKVIYPVHLNPNVQRPVKNILCNVPNVHLLKPLDYYSFVYLLSRSFLIITDSGGIQEEAPSLGKPVLVLRKTTERPEGIEAGTARLVGTSSGAIFDGAASLIENATLYARMARATNPYGDGNASERIVSALVSELGLTKKRHDFT
jgi:UDP-N-acetylglucosamine 2-epimerase (non-hydrolysing)